MQLLEFPHLCEDEQKRVAAIKLNLCDRCLAMEQVTDEECAMKVASLFAVIHSAPIFFIGDEEEYE